MAPVGAINTIPATGSETSSSSVLVDDIDNGKGYKKGFMWAVCRPVFAIMNPELTYSLPAYQKSASAADIFSHSYLRFFSNSSSFLGDAYCVSTMRTVVKYAESILANPDDYESHAEIMLAGTFSNNDLTSIGRDDKKRGGEHPLEHQLSGYCDTPHGAGLAVMMPALLDYVLRHGTTAQIARVAQFGTDVFNATPDFDDIVSTAVCGIKQFRAWLKSIGMPLTLEELGISEDDAMIAAQRCIGETNGLISGFIEIDENGIMEIYNSVMR
jgi:alcohol dehydrogenase YqhD (iron-dependent ADH family)